MKRPEAPTATLPRPNPTRMAYVREALRKAHDGFARGLGTRLVSMQPRASRACLKHRW